MPGEGKHDDDESCDDSLSLASSAPEAPAPKRSGAEGITVFLRMRPTKKPSKYYDISDAVNAAQPKPPKLTGNEDADDDIRAFYAAKEELAVLQAKR